MRVPAAPARRSSGMSGLARARNGAFSGAAARHALVRARAKPARTTCSRVDEHLCQPGSARGWFAFAATHVMSCLSATHLMFGTP